MFHYMQQYHKIYIYFSEKSGQETGIWGSLHPRSHGGVIRKYNRQALTAAPVCSAARTA